MGVLDEDDIAEAAPKLSAAKFKQKHLGQLSREELKEAGVEQGVIKDFMEYQRSLNSQAGATNVCVFVCRVLCRRV